eukprot:5415786-Pleurochrysis_carterae.AAC.1
MGGGGDWQWAAAATTRRAGAWRGASCEGRAVKGRAGAPIRVASRPLHLLCARPVARSRLPLPSDALSVALVLASALA